jgi:hypothetical protein
MSENRKNGDINPNQLTLDLLAIRSSSYDPQLIVEHLISSGRYSKHTIAQFQETLNQVQIDQLDTSKINN